MFDKLKQLRIEKRVTCDTMAEFIGLKTRSTYHKKENGNVPFSLIEAKKIAVLFKMTIEDIFFADEVSYKQIKKNEEREKMNGIILEKEWNNGCELEHYDGNITFKGSNADRIIYITKTQVINHRNNVSIVTLTDTEEKQSSYVIAELNLEKIYSEEVVEAIFVADAEEFYNPYSIKIAIDDSNAVWEITKKRDENYVNEYTFEFLGRLDYPINLGLLFDNLDETEPFSYCPPMWRIIRELDNWTCDLKMLKNNFELVFNLRKPHKGNIYLANNEVSFEQKYLNDLTVDGLYIKIREYVELVSYGNNGDIIEAENQTRTSYKIGRRNFMEVEKLKNKINIFLRLNLTETEIAKMLSNNIKVEEMGVIGRHGSGNIKVWLYTLEDFAKVKDWIKRAYEAI